MLGRGGRCTEVASGENGQPRSSLGSTPDGGGDCVKAQSAGRGHLPYL